MLPPKKKPVAQHRLQTIFDELDADNRQTLLAFAEFLRERQPGSAKSSPEAGGEPLDIPRPSEESVVAAIRRLAQTYPMLNREELLHQASSLMSAHVMQGRSARAVIDELQDLFAQAYQRYAADKS